MEIFLYSGLRAHIQVVCNRLYSVEDSTLTWKTNVNYGGHVWEHIYGLQQAPSGARGSQYGGSMFKSPADFKYAWTHLKGEGQCNYGNRDTDCVDAKTLGIYSAYQCTRANSNGICNRVTEFTPSKVVFWYYKYEDGWILKTAYPASQCSNF